MSEGFLQNYLEPLLGRWLYVDSTLWTAVGFLGAAIFGSRFILQWLKSEKEKKLVVPWYFWHLSFWGSVLNLLYFLHIDKAPLILGNCFLPFLYGRNILFLRRSGTRGGGRKVLAAVVVLMVAVFSYTAMTDDKVAVLRKDELALDEMKGAIAALKRYQAGHGALPVGDTRAIVKALRGEKAQGGRFLDVREDRITGEGDWLDPWGQPYWILASGGEILIRSSGVNLKLDDGLDGKGDDILLQESVK